MSKDKVDISFQRRWTEKLEEQDQLEEGQLGRIGKDRETVLGRQGNKGTCPLKVMSSFLVISCTN
jgi:hypothetical protein